MSHTERAKYRTDLTDEQWQILRKTSAATFAPRGAPDDLPSRHPRRDHLCCPQWLPLAASASRIPQLEDRLWDLLPLAQRRDLAEDSRHAPGHASVSPGRKKSPSAAIIDSQTVKTTEVGGQRGYDAGKKINGRKRHIVVDTLGLILALVVHPADVQDQDGAVLVLGILGRLKERFHRLKVIFADSAYGRNNLPECVKDAFGWLLQTVLRPARVKGFVVLPKRWIVERTFGWLGRYRRHSKDYERNVASSEAMIHIAMIHLMIRRLAYYKS